MARKALEVKSKRTPKFSSRVQRRCWRCGRIRGYMRQFDMCRICFRELASKGEVPGYKRASW